MSDGPGAWRSRTAFDPEKLRAVARLGERCYLKGDSWQVVELARPDVPDDLAVHRE